MEALGGRLAQAMLSAGGPLPGKGLVIYLCGPLGAGKTTLVRGFLGALGHRGVVRSPTYTLVEAYEWAAYNVYHFDLYRVSAPEELEHMGARDYFAPGNVCLVEWPERGAGLLPEADIALHIAYAGSARRVEAQGGSGAGEAILEWMGKGLTAQS